MTIAQANHKIPPAGTRPVFGNVLNAPFIYEVDVFGGFEVECHAFNEEEARRVVERNGYSVRRLRQVAY